MAWIQTYLPRDTPAGLKKLRELEFQELRGDGTGTRQKWDRVYDYDVYNDLGNVEKDSTTKRPILGAGEFKYPRRCRTGRPMCKGGASLDTPIIVKELHSIFSDKRA